jgi:hypothetical protein
MLHTHVAWSTVVSVHLSVPMADSMSTWGPAVYALAGWAIRRL